MVKARTTNDYLKTNMETFGKHLEGYVYMLREGGKTDSACKNTKARIRAFLARCRPMSPQEITAEVMAEVDVIMEADNLTERYRLDAMIHMGRFIEFITGTNPYTGIDPDNREEWSAGHMGDFLFSDELDEYIESLTAKGMSPISIRRKRIHIVECCRVLRKERDILSVEQIDEGCFWFLDDMMECLTEKTRNRILYDLDGFVRYCTKRIILKAYKRKRRPIRDYEATDVWKEFMEMAEAYRTDMEERGLRPRSVSGIMYSVVEGYRLIIERFGIIPAKDVDYHHMRGLRNSMTGLKQRTVKLYLGRLGRMLEFFFGTNPYTKAGLLWSSESVDRTWIFRSQWKILWNSADVTERLILALGGGMGLRREEIAGLKISDIQGSKMLIRGKGSGPDGKVIEKDIPPTLLRCISEYMDERERITGAYGDHADDNLLVMDSVCRGSAATIRFVETKVKGLALRTDISVTCHTLRRFYCMAMVDSGVEMDTVRRMMRHEHITTTYDYYVNADPRKLHRATDTIESAVFG